MEPIKESKTSMTTKIRRLWNSILDFEITSEKVYFVAFVLYFIASFFVTTTYLEFISFHWLNYISYISIGLLLAKMVLFDRYNRIQAIFYLIVIPMVLLTWMYSQSNFAFIMTMFILGSRNIEFKKIIKWHLYLGITMMVFAFLSSTVGIIKNLTYYRSGNIRQSFGIIYPTDFASHVFYLILAFTYLNFRKLNWKHYMIYFFISIAFIIFSDARLDAICVLLVIPIIFVARKADLSNKGAKRIAAMFWMGTPILTFIAIMATFFYDQSNRIFATLNNLLSNRLSLSNEGFQKYGFNAFGKAIIEHGWGGLSGSKAYSGSVSSFKYFMLDSSYIRIFLFYGVFFALGLFIAVTILSIKRTALRDYSIPAILLLISISCLVDQHMLELAYNPFLLALSAYFVNNHHQKNSEEINYV